MGKRKRGWRSGGARNTSTNCFNSAVDGARKILIGQSDNRPRSIYQYSSMAPRLSGQTSIFGVVFFVSKSLCGIERQKKLKKFAIFTRKPRSDVRILIYRTWPIGGVGRNCMPIDMEILSL